MQLADERPQHGLIDFEGLPNTRDLGGLPTTDGRRVRPGLLLRSGTLYFATSDDRRRLLEDYHLRCVVDLRGEDELVEYPDRMEALPGVRYVHVDVLRDVIAGISQSSDARSQLAEAERDQDDPARFMEVFYPHILLDDSGVAAYRTLLESVLATTKGSVLWHCHVGRDRCGMASMLVEALLGVPTELMEQDYLATNLYTDVPSDERTAANPRFFRAALGAVERAFGSVEGYARAALGLSQSDLDELRRRYLA